MALLSSTSEEKIQVFVGTKESKVMDRAELFSLGLLLRLSITDSELQPQQTNCVFTAVNHNYGDNRLTTKIQKLKWSEIHQS